MTAWAFLRASCLELTPFIDAKLGGLLCGELRCSSKWSTHWLTTSAIVDDSDWSRNVSFSNVFCALG